MNTKQARVEAQRRWSTGTLGDPKPEDHIAFVTIRRKDKPLRFEVGYYVRGGVGIGAGVPNGWFSVVMGRGDTWEDAFAMADASRGTP